MNDKPPEGYKCIKCDKFHRFGPYVYAHWGDKLVHKCDGCGEPHLIRYGKAKLDK